MGDFVLPLVIMGDGFPEPGRSTAFNLTRMNKLDYSQALDVRLDSRFSSFLSDPPDGHHG